MATINAMRELDAKLVAYLAATDNDDDVNADDDDVMNDNDVVNAVGDMIGVGGLDCYHHQLKSPIQYCVGRQKDKKVIMKATGQTMIAKGKAKLESLEKQSQQPHVNMDSMMKNIIGNKNIYDEMFIDIDNNNRGEPMAVAKTMMETETETETEMEAETTTTTSMINDEQLAFFEKFKRMCSIKLEMEALALQPEGSKLLLESLQNEIRPIFTMECQLSNELVKAVQPRYDMFHVMQFESEKFQHQNQCIRVGQEAMRSVKLEMNKNEGGDDGDARQRQLKEKYANAKHESTQQEQEQQQQQQQQQQQHEQQQHVDIKLMSDEKPNFGRIYFTVWWRETGTCLNEMLGMGKLELSELYEANLLQQCKRINIMKCNVLLAHLYLKISIDTAKDVVVIDKKANTNIISAVASSAADKMKSAATTVANAKPVCVATQAENNDAEPKKSNGIDCADAAGRAKAVAAAAAAAATATASAIEENGICMKNASDSDNKSGGEKNVTNATAPSSSSSANTTERISYNTTDRAATTPQHTLQRANDNNNRNVQVDITKYSSEMLSVRLLCGFINVDEVRDFVLDSKTDYLICRRFWENDIAAIVPDGLANKFNYQEQFAVLNDDIFLRRMERQTLQLEIWRRPAIAADNSDNANSLEIKPLGIVRMPLHQYYIAYRDAAITNHMCKGKLPVISFDAWAPIVRCDNGQKMGEIKCLLAIGSDEQIFQLKQTHGFDATVTPDMVNATGASIDKTMFAQQPEIASTTTAAAATGNLLHKQRQHLARNTLQKYLGEQQQPEQQLPSKTASPASPFKPLQQSNTKSFRFQLEVQAAHGLPSSRFKKSAAKHSGNNKAHNKQQRLSPGNNEAPSTYVTFQADEGCDECTIYKSHEGDVYATKIIERSTQPQWQQRFRISVSVDYLLNPQKRFILKVWRKTETNIKEMRCQPMPMKDTIIGFSALDLGVFLRNYIIDGQFNIVDFNGRITGQLKLSAQPLENVHKLLQMEAPTGLSLAMGTHMHTQTHITQPLPTATAAAAAASSSISEGVEAAVVGGRGGGRGADVGGGRTANNAFGTQSSMDDSFIDQFENSLNLAHLNLGQAIKRKLGELGEISQRLRSRLADVTGEELAPRFDANILDNWQAFQKEADDEAEFNVDKFERDLNTPPSPLSPSTTAAVAALAAAAAMQQETQTVSTELDSDANKASNSDAKPKQ